MLNVVNRKWLSLVCGAALVGAAAGPAWAQAPAAADPKAPNTGTTSSMSIAVQAASFAVEGVKRHSPMMLLAAAELAGELKKGAHGPDAVKVEVSGKAHEGGESLPSLEPKALMARALEYCGDNAELKAAVETMIKKIDSGERGIVYSQGKDLPKYDIGGTTFAIINTSASNQQLDPGSTYTATNVIFEAARPAHVVVVGDGDGDLDLYVYDGNDNFIGKDTDYSSVCEVSWVPRYEGPFKIVVHNSGRVWEQFYVLCNW